MDISRKFFRQRLIILLNDFQGDLLIETQSNVLTKFVKGMMAPKQVKKEDVDEEEECKCGDPTLSTAN